MIPRGVEVFVGLEPIDLRWSFDRLAGIVVERIGREPRSRALFVFFGKRHAAVKVLFFGPEEARGAGFEVVETTPLDRDHKFGTPKMTSGAPNPFTDNTTTTTYKKIP